MEVCGKNIRVRGGVVRIAYLDGEGYQFLRADEAVAKIRTAGTRVDLYTFIGSLSESAGLYTYPFRSDNMAALAVSTYDHWLTRQINAKARNMVRKAEKKGLIVREVKFDAQLVEGIHAIYDETPIRQGRPFAHFGRDLEYVREIKGTFLKQSIFIGAFLENELVGFAKLVISDDGAQAGLMHILSMLRHRDKAPTNALIAQAVRSCAERRVPYLWYANFDYGKKPHDSLAEFKLHNGFQRVDIPRYYVPLTVLGKTVLYLGLENGFGALVPEFVGSTYRRIRKAWYARIGTGRYQSSAANTSY